MGCSIEDARNVKEKAKEIFSKYGSVGIHRTTDGYGIKVNLERRVSGDTVLPDSIDGVPVEFEFVGKTRKSEC